MSHDLPPPPPGNLSHLPDDSPSVRAAVAELRRRAEGAEESIRTLPFLLSEAHLVRFLRARDFDGDLAWKVKSAGARRARACTRAHAWLPASARARFIGSVGELSSQGVEGGDALVVLLLPPRLFLSAQKHS